MMTSELSDQAKSLLDDIKSLSIIDAARYCLDLTVFDNKIGIESADKLVKILSANMKRNHSDSYLCSSISAIKVEEITIRRAEKWASTGFVFHGKTYKLERPFNWDTYPGATRNHRYKIQAWFMIDELLWASRIDNRKEFFEIARDVAIDWIDNFIFGNSVDDYAWYDMGVGQRSALLAYITQQSLLQPPTSRKKSDRETQSIDILKLIIASQVHIHELINEERLAFHSNHGLFQMSGLLAISNSIPILRSAKEGQGFAISRIEKMLSEHFFDDGFHKEHSPMYHMYVSNYLHQLEEANWLPASPSLSELGIKSKISVQNFIMPDGFFAPIGDSSASNSADVLCIFPIHTDSKGTPSAPPGIHVYPEGGAVIISTNTNQGQADEHLVFTGQFHSRQHKHADDLTINYCVKGKRYLIDAGTFTYHYDQEERMFIESTRAHNTVEIDGLNFSRFRLDKYGSALNRVATIGDCTIMEGIVHHKRLIDSMIPNNKITLADSIEVDLTHRRIIFHKPNYFLAVVDVLSSTENHDYTQWFHLSPNLNAEIISESLLEVKDSTGKVHSTIHHLHDESNDSKVTLTSGQKKPRMQGFHSINGLELIPHQTLGFSINSDKGVLSTVFDLKGGKKKPYLNIGSNGKYIRFAISQDETETDIKIREQSDGSVLVESTNTTEIYKEIFSAN